MNGEDFKDDEYDEDKDDWDDVDDEDDAVSEHLAILLLFSNIHRLCLPAFGHAPLNAGQLKKKVLKYLSFQLFENTWNISFL